MATEPITNYLSPEALATAVALVFKTIVQVVPSAFGAFVSLRFLPEGLSRWKLLTAWLSAWATGTFFGRGVSEYLDISNTHVADALMFGFAVFGLAFVGAVLNEIPKIISTIRQKYAGGSNGSGEA